MLNLSLDLQAGVRISTYDATISFSTTGVAKGNDLYKGRFSDVIIIPLCLDVTSSTGSIISTILIQFDEVPNHLVSTLRFGLVPSH